jgi:hypothetical protein
MADAQEHFQAVLDELIARRARLDATISGIQEEMGKSSAVGTAPGSATVISLPPAPACS